MAHAGSINDNLAWIYPDSTFYYAGGDFSNCTVSVCPAELSVYGYRPSLAASGTLIALYSLCMIVQIILGFRYKTWWFMACMVLGCVDEIIGYVGRILYWQNPWGQAGFLIQIILITIGPVFFAGAIYVLLSQMSVFSHPLVPLCILTTPSVNYISPKASRFPPKLYYWLFIPADITSLILQAVGGAMSSTSNGDSSAGVNIALAGLSLQVATLVIFSLLVLDYFIRSRSIWRQAQLSTRFKVFCAALAAATVLILIRCAYRIFELSEGYSRTSEALRDEPLFIGLESV